MWPFRDKTPILYESPELLAFERTLENVRQLICELSSGSRVPDERMRDVYFSLAKLMQSNCDAVASGLLSTIGSICANSNHMTREFLPSAMQPIYHLGIEDLEGLQSYISHVAEQKNTYLDTQTQLGSAYLNLIADDTILIVESFREMYDAEDNEWRIKDPDVPDTPAILMG